MCRNQLLLAGLSTGSVYFLTVPSDHTVATTVNSSALALALRVPRPRIPYTILQMYCIREIEKSIKLPMLEL